MARRRCIKVCSCVVVCRDWLVPSFTVEPISESAEEGRGGVAYFFTIHQMRPGIVLLVRQLAVPRAVFSPLHYVGLLVLYLGGR